MSKTPCHKWKKKKYAQNTFTMYRHNNSNKKDNLFVHNNLSEIEAEDAALLNIICI